MGQPSTHTFGPRDRITIATAWTLITGTIMITGMFVKIMLSVASLEQHVTADWDLKDMNVWTAQFIHANGTNLVVPDPVNVHRMMR